MLYNSEYMENYIEAENAHLFGFRDNLTSILSQNNDVENEESIERALGYSQKFGDGYYDAPQKFGDGYYDLNEFEELEELDEYRFFNLKKETEIETEKIKSWLINLETKETKLSISDIDDGTIPEILKDYEWLLDLEIDCQQIKEIKNLPKNLKNLSLFNNKIELIPEMTLPESLEVLNLSRNSIKVLENIPKSVKELDISHNLIESCRIKENSELLELSVECNLINEFPELPDSLKKLDISQNLLTEIRDIPDYIEDLDISVNKIALLEKLPANAKRVNAYNNNIKNFTKYPPNLEYLDMSFNELFWISRLPESLKRADFSNNQVKLIALFDEQNRIDNKNGKLSGSYEINLCYNPLSPMQLFILNDPRIKHNMVFPETVIATPVKEYYRITHLKKIVI